MIIETAHNINEEVWLIEDRKVKKGIVTCIQPTVIKAEELFTVYGIKINDNSAINVSEQYLFKSREELITSL